MDAWNARIFLWIEGQEGSDIYTGDTGSCGERLTMTLTRHSDRSIIHCDGPVPDPEAALRLGLLRCVPVHEVLDKGGCLTDPIIGEVTH